ncbi:hypothetical protein TIFTF001_011538 [Ficus carica]|uniref:Uncharacterized protein n=1 Tax=Ficus carica TaxID=3494 RepID=A0AA88DHW7_FICCA|nr:hypothetical protein TIFTF001_011538 [Ficus carica]
MRAMASVTVSNNDDGERPRQAQQGATTVNGCLDIVFGEEFWRRWAIVSATTGLVSRSYGPTPTPWKLSSRTNWAKFHMTWVFS